MKKVYLILIGILLSTLCFSLGYSYDDFDTVTRGVTDTSKLIETYRDFIENANDLEVLKMVEDVWMVMDEASLRSHLTKMSMKYPKDSLYYFLLGRIEKDPVSKISYARKTIKNDRRAIHGYEMMLKTYNDYFFGNETLSPNQIQSLSISIKKDKRYGRELLRQDMYNRIGIAFDTNYVKYKAELKAAKKRKK